MGVITFSVKDLLEQGSIGSSGNFDSNTAVRLQNRPMILFPPELTISATSSTGKQVQVDFLGYSDSTGNRPICDLYWFDSPHTFDLSSYQGINYFRLVLKYNDSTNITPEEITSCTVSYVTNYWQIDDNGVLVNPQSPPLPLDSNIPPLPKAMYRVENGILTHKLLQELPKKPFIPELPKAVYRVFDADLLHLLLPKKDFSQEVTPFIVNNKGVECNIFYFGNLPTYFVVYRTKMSRNATERGGDTNAE